MHNVGKLFIAKPAYFYGVVNLLGIIVKKLSYGYEVRYLNKNIVGYRIVYNNEINILKEKSL